MSDATVAAGPLLIVEANLPRDPRLFVRDHGRFLNAAFRATAAEHHRRHIPWHFLPFARAKYGYRPRSKRYAALKARLGLPDMVFSGATRQKVTTERQITATQKGARLILRLAFEGGSGRLRLRGQQTKLSTAQQQILYRIAELQAIAPDESKYLADFLQEKYLAQANAPGVRYRVRKQISA